MCEDWGQKYFGLLGGGGAEGLWIKGYKKKERISIIKKIVVLLLVWNLKKREGVLNLYASNIWKQNLKK